MASQIKISLSSAVITFVAIMTVVAGAVGIGSFAGFTARDKEVDEWRQAYKQVAANVPEWIHGTDKRYGKYSLVTLDRGKNYYAAIKKNGGILILGSAEGVYPGILARVKQAPRWETLPGVETARKYFIFT